MVRTEGTEIRALFQKPKQDGKSGFYSIDKKTHQFKKLKTDYREEKNMEENEKIT